MLNEVFQVEAPLCERKPSSSLAPPTAKYAKARIKKAKMAGEKFCL
jgi:hypothetical protein